MNSKEESIANQNPSAENITDTCKPGWETEEEIMAAGIHRIAKKLLAKQESSKSNSSDDSAPSEPA